MPQAGFGPELSSAQPLLKGLCAKGAKSEDGHRRGVGCLTWLPGVCVCGGLQE